MCLLVWQLDPLSEFLLVVSVETFGSLPLKPADDGSLKLGIILSQVRVRVKVTFQVGVRENKILNETEF